MQSLIGGDLERLIGITLGVLKQGGSRKASVRVRVRVRIGGTGRKRAIQRTEKGVGRQPAERSSKRRCHCDCGR